MERVINFLKRLFGRRGGSASDTVAKVVCPGCGAVYELNLLLPTSFESRCGACHSTLKIPKISPEARDIALLIKRFDWGMADAQSAEVALSRMGDAVIPPLIGALQGGTMQKFHAACTLGKIGLDSQVGLIKLGGSMRRAARKAVDVALRDETENGVGAESQQICEALRRAQANLS